MSGITTAKACILFFILLSTLPSLNAQGTEVVVQTDKREYTAGDDITIRIGAENSYRESIEVSKIEYRIVYTSAGMSVLEGERVWQKTVPPGGAYYSSRQSFDLPDFVPPGEYRITASLVEDSGEVLATGGTVIAVEPNYPGIARALGIALVFALAVLTLFAIIFLSRRGDSEPLLSPSNLLSASIPEIFVLFALVSMAVFPLALYTNRMAADDGFLFAFICLAAGTFLELAKARLKPLQSSFPTEKTKALTFGALSIALLYLGYIWLNVIGALLSLLGIIAVAVLAAKGLKLSVEKQKYSFGRKDLYCIAALLFLSLFSIRELLTTQPIFYYDWSGFGPEALQGLKQWELSEIFHSRPPNPMLISFAPLILLLGNEIASNIYLLVWLPLAGVALYLLAAKLIKNRLPALLASFIYIFNPELLDRFLSAHVGILAGYALMPLILFLFITALEEKFSVRPIALSLIAGLLLALSGSTQSHFYYLNPMLLILFLFFYSIAEEPRKTLKRGIPLIFIILSSGALFSLPWLLPTLDFASFGYYSAAVTPEYLQGLSTETYLYNNLRLIGQSGGLFMQSVGYTGLSIWPIAGFIFLLLSFSPLLLQDKGAKKLFLAFSPIALISIFLSTGTMYSGLYGWLYENFPFFYAFREPSKFLIPGSLALSMLAGAATGSVLSLRRARGTKTLVALSLALVLLSHSIFAWPMLTGDNQLYSLYPRHTITKDYRELGSWINSHSSEKTVILPYTGFTTRSWRFVSEKELVFIGMYCLSPSQDCGAKIFMLDTLKRGDTEGFAVLAGLEGIKHVVIDKEPEQGKATPDIYTFIPPSERFNFSGGSLASSLEQSSAFEKVQKFGSYLVFENREYTDPAARREPVLAVGNRNIILDMAKDKDFSRKRLIFATQPESGKLAELTRTTSITLQHSKEEELTFALLDDKYKISAYEHAFPAGVGDDPRNIIYERWIRSDVYEFLEGGAFGRGALTYGRGYAITRGEAELSIRTSLESPGTYELWLRCLGNSSLSASIDGRKTGSKKIQSQEFYWVKIGSAELSGVEHGVKIAARGETLLDLLVLAPSPEIDAAKEAKMKILSEKSVTN